MFDVVEEVDLFCTLATFLTLLRPWDVSISQLARQSATHFDPFFLAPRCIPGSSVCRALATFLWRGKKEYWCPFTEVVLGQTMPMPLDNQGGVFLFFFGFCIYLATFLSKLAMASLQSDLKKNATFWTDSHLEIAFLGPIFTSFFFFFLPFGPKPQIFVERSKFSVPQKRKNAKFPKQDKCREKERRPRPNKKCHLWHSEKYELNAS